jgi:hypothetical protein
MILEKYSFGVGDRFAHQGKAQLNAMIKAEQLTCNIVPVWNKSHREHCIIHTEPASVRQEADAAVKALGWKNNYYVDADHINMSNVDAFVDSSDFFTLDVADYIGQKAPDEDIREFVAKCDKYRGNLTIEGIDDVIEVTQERITQIASKVLLAIQHAGNLYRYIESKKGKDDFITEVSMDETDLAQTPVEMLFILAAISEEGIPAQTIAPKFTGRFNKGVDYVGDVKQFEKEFNQDLAVIKYAIKEFGLPENLKLSVHSGSDKFSIYAPINRALEKFETGLHLKTAGTTWLEEIIGLASAGGQGLEIARKIYAAAYERFDELCGPYATVIDIDKTQLPAIADVNTWTGQMFKDTVTHDQTCPGYNLHVRQLLHVGYKVASEMGSEYIDALEKYEVLIADHVTENIFERHIRPIFADV